MKFRLQRTPKKDQIEQVFDAIGGEKLAGSGFEGERPEEGFSAASVLVPPAPPAPGVRDVSGLSIAPRKEEQ